jgi:hypothetical protein
LLGAQINRFVPGIKIHCKISARMVMKDLENARGAVT